MTLAPPFHSFEALTLFLRESPYDLFVQNLPLLSLHEIEQCLELLKESPAVERKEKLHALFHHFHNAHALSALSEHLSPSLFIEYLDILREAESNPLPFISELLIKLKPALFSHALLVLTNAQIALLKEEAQSLHYQLVQFLHEGETLQEEIERQGELFRLSLLQIDPLSLTKESLNSLLLNIEALREALASYLRKLEVALSLAWCSARADLIDRLSQQRELIQHLQHDFLGLPAKNYTAATGLYLALEKTFSAIFDAELKDEDSAIEGLTRLGIWDAKDYFNIGFFPSISHLEEIETPHPAGLQIGLHPFSLAMIQEKLRLLSIEKVRDLKRQHLFSPALVREYIQDHRKKLQSAHRV